MVRKCTGNPTGRPKGSIIPLKEHLNKLHLALADVFECIGKMSGQEARLRVTLFMTGTDAQPIPFDKMSEKMREYFEKGWNIMSVEIPGGGNPTSRKIKERFQAIDTLEKMAARYSTPEDLGYRTSLATLVALSLFAKGNKGNRYERPTFPMCM